MLHLDLWQLSHSFQPVGAFSLEGQTASFRRNHPGEECHHFSTFFFPNFLGKATQRHHQVLQKERAMSALTFSNALSHQVLVARSPRSLKLTASAVNLFGNLFFPSQKDEETEEAIRNQGSM